MKISHEEISNRTLNPETVREAADQVRVNGFVVLEGMLSKEKVSGLHAVFMNLFEAHIAKTESNRGKNRTQMFLPFEGPFIDPEIVTNPFALPIMEELLGKDCAIKYFASDTPLPGSDYQAVHSDMKALYPESSVTLPTTGVVLNIPLVDFRADNGPVEIWPGGTHLIPENANRPEHIQKLAQQMHSEPVIMPAGSLLIRDIRMWHRGTPNQSDAARPNLAMVYFRSWFHTEPKIAIPRTTYESLSERAKQLFRFEHIYE
ncbi:phytanoyl-CoA dioxygenase family protein [Paenibacillus spongiae]|uniref:Phytanoyl-CoA dioxygenase family protein n=1 Tax=Paenibacillus spongiae TaxID=2909671 RepID=A0ABY5S5I7_9BACL|nr:phytanoyl-CoA dioxygenase family protein [Paenibacillus spongiae]UVI29169.1 phytanoyl-CoA dioxygenase family protein [Paenibacillus spongiae]